jgi:hypothetical protein
MNLNDWTFYGEVILGTRLTLHIVTIWSIVAYTSGHRSRLMPTVLAIIIGGCSGAAAFQVVTEWRSMVFTTQPWVMGLVFSLAVICVYSKGNMSRPLRFFYR